MTSSANTRTLGRLSIDSEPADADPFRVLCTIHRRPHPFFLDSGMDPQRLGRFSFVGCDPVLTIRCDGHTTFINDQAAGRNPFDVLRSVLRQYSPAIASDAEPPVPFTGGLVGYLAYDLGRFIEKLPATAAADSALPPMHFALYDTVAGFDHQSHRWHVATRDLGFPGLADRRRRLVDAIRNPDPLPSFALPAAANLRSNFTKPDYLAAVRRAIDYIAAGDIFQVNLSQRFTAETDASPLDLYASLRAVNPAPFAAYLPVPGGAILSSSPERFLKVARCLVETRPIKGTRPRCEGDAAFNDAMRRELLASAKDRAELTMIVDLERNDLGRVCSYGTVHVTDPLTLEEYPTVHHLVATVRGELHPAQDIVSLLKATFPGGSITGAPKIRSMEIIDELEPTRRSVYTGSIGYIGLDGSADLNIAIRTMILSCGRVHIQAGGGIVADSQPESEYAETLDKARALLRAIGASL